MLSCGGGVVVVDGAGRGGGRVLLHDGDRHRSRGAVVAAAGYRVRDLHRRIALSVRRYGHRLRRSPVVGGERQCGRLQLQHLRRLRRDGHRAGGLSAKRDPVGGRAARGHGERGGLQGHRATSTAGGCGWWAVRLVGGVSTGDGHLTCGQQYRQAEHRQRQRRCEPSAYAASGNGYASCRTGRPGRLAVRSAVAHDVQRSISAACRPVSGPDNDSRTIPTARERSVNKHPFSVAVP